MKLRRIEGKVMKETRNKMEIKGIRKLNNQKEEGMGYKREKQRGRKDKNKDREKNGKLY